MKEVAGGHPTVGAALQLLAFGLSCTANIIALKVHEKHGRRIRGNGLCSWPDRNRDGACCQARLWESRSLESFAADNGRARVDGADA